MGISYLSAGDAPLRSIFEHHTLLFSRMGPKNSHMVKG